ncbi:MAG: hypothetical protein ABI876_14810 [Bacteroidota bacterium]
MSDPISFSSITVDADGITGFNQRKRKILISMEEIQSLEIVRGNVSEWPKTQIAAGILCLCWAVVRIGIGSIILVGVGIWLINLSRYKELILVVTREGDAQRLSLGKEIATTSLYRFIEDVRRVYGLEITLPPVD